MGPPEFKKYSLQKDKSLLDPFGNCLQEQSYSLGLEKVLVP